MHGQHVSVVNPPLDFTVAFGDQPASLIELLASPHYSAGLRPVLPIQDLESRRVAYGYQISQEQNRQRFDIVELLDQAIAELDDIQELDFQLSL